MFRHSAKEKQQNGQSIEASASYPAISNNYITKK